MANKRYADLIRQLDKKTVSARVYYLYGEEHLLQDELVEKIIKALDISDKEVFYGSNFNIDDFLSSIASMSLFAGERFVIVKEANKIKKPAEKIIAGILEKNDLTSRLVFVNPVKLKKTELAANGLIAVVSKIGEVVEVSPLDENGCVDFIVEELNKSKKNISRENAGLLYQLSGSNLFDIKNEIEKLSLFARSRATISQDDIYACCGIDKQENIFDLEDAILNNDKHRVLGLIENIIGGGRVERPEQFILNSIYRIYNTMLTSIQLLKNNVPPASICGIIKRHPYYGGEYLRKVKKITISEKEIVKKFELIHRIELEMKSGKVEKPDLRIYSRDFCLR